MSKNILEKYNPEFLIRLYRKMLLIRRFEERASELRNAGHIPGFLHPCIGQEAVAVGICAALGKNDFIASNHRGHGHILAQGGEPKYMYAELFARTDGYNRAKGGSLHLANIGLGIIGANGIVGGGIPLAVGAALAIKRANEADYPGTERCRGGVSVVFFGDGASNEGSFHESLNLAALWKLPVIFVCENNLYGEFTSQEKHQTIKDIASRSSSYNMPGLIADGNDVLDAFHVMTTAVNNARKGNGPTLLECKTYRHRGHYEGDMARYRPKEEVDYWMAKDPINNFGKRLLEDSIVTEEQLKDLENEIDKELAEAAEFAGQSPHPGAEEAFEHVFVESYNGKALL